jgi:hypothetical protein
MIDDIDEKHKKWVETKELIIIDWANLLKRQTELGDRKGPINTIADEIHNEMVRLDLIHDLDYNIVYRALSDEYKREKIYIPYLLRNRYKTKRIRY